MATDNLYIIPENSTVANCPSQPCATLSGYFLNRSLISFISNFNIYLLPGKHHLVTNLELWNVSSVSLIGINNHKASLVMLDCLSKSHIAFYDSYNITIANVLFNQCDSKINIETKYQHQKQHYSQAGLLLFNCLLCKIQNTIFLGYGLIGVNLIGKSCLINVTINLYTATPDFDNDLCPSRILIAYTDEDNNYAYNDVEVLVLDNIFISNNSINCRNTNLYTVIEVYLHQSLYGVTIKLNNSWVYNMDQTVIKVDTACSVRNTLWIKDCTFTHNEYNSMFMITITTLNINITIKFVNCSFSWNKYMDSLIDLHVKEVNYTEIGCNSLCAYTVTNISFENCDFIKNVAQLLYLSGEKKTKYMANVYLKHSEISGTVATNSSMKYDAVYFKYTAVNMIGTTNVSENIVTRSIIAFQSSDITFTKTTIFSFNKCIQVIALVSPAAYVRLTEFAHITFTNNNYKNTVIALEVQRYYKPYPFCLFQYMENNSSVLMMTNSVSIIDSLFYHGYFYTLFQYFCHCKWLPAAEHYGFNPGTFNHHLIQVNKQPWHYHKRICYCPQLGYSNCSIDILGPIYPGQVLQLQLCIPEAEENYTLYAETLSDSLPNSTCAIAHQTELINTIGSIPKTINFTIIFSEYYKECELFLTIEPYIYEYYDAFYVQLLSCPIGFTLQDGACKCDPLLPSKITSCFIDYSAVNRPADTWITADTQTNNTKYLISDCPMDYCLPYSSYVNLQHPDTQCQFSRAGILCSQCQHPLSMVFGSSRCMQCTNLHILITTGIIMAGILLVVLLYLLNLTVTSGLSME